MKLYDCCMYFDEDLMLDLRLNILKDCVNNFIIVEATKDHTGKDKKLNFNINNFPKFKDRITYIIVDDMPVNLSSYKKNWPVHHLRDQHQRNALSRGYKNCDDNDLIMISDIDEIPDPNKIKEFQIEKKLVDKPNNTFLCLRKNKTIEGKLHFKFFEGFILNNILQEKIDKMYKKGLYFDIGARTHHNHGTKLRMKKKNLFELFKTTEKILG